MKYPTIPIDNMLIIEDSVIFSLPNRDDLNKKYANIISAAMSVINIIWSFPKNLTDAFKNYYVL
jgi:hypothetical protein